MKIINQSVAFIAATPNIGEVIERGCRTCYKSEHLIKEGSAERLFNQVVKQSHHDSVAEHGYITLQVVTDRATLAQITRHRSLSFSVESQRYNSYIKDKFGNEITVIAPYFYTQKPFDEAATLWENAMKHAEHHYFKLLKAGCTPEQARSVLPNSTKTEFTVSGNVRSWRNFFKLRKEGTHAQAEIQELTTLIHQCMMENGIPTYLFDDVMNHE